MIATLSRSKKTLTITIGESVKHYDITDLEPDRAVALKAFRLKRDDGSFEDVHLSDFGAECTCGQFLFRNPDNIPCKHIRGLRDVGLFPKEYRQMESKAFSQKDLDRLRSVFGDES